MSLRSWLLARGSAPFELRYGVDVTIGRGHTCELSLYSSMLSREHARVRWENGRPVLFDLDSLNGTFVGLDKVARHTLSDGDVVRLGDISLLYRVSHDAPAALADDEEPSPTPSPVAAAAAEEAEEAEPTNETRIYSRTAVLHQRVFDYDELGWLVERAEPWADALRHEALVGADLGRWFDAIGRDEGVLWSLLGLGVLRPRDWRVALRGMSPAQVVQACQVTRRAEKLRARLEGHQVVWNEMAALRYQVRQGPVFKPLRLVARAYRPGVGLDEVTPGRLALELEQIYAPELAGAPLEGELRRLQVLGVLAPAPGRGPEAWFSLDWGDGTVELSRRGRAMLEGFRLEE